MRGPHGPGRSVRVFEEPRRLSLALAERFAGTAAAAVGERGRFVVAPSGGQTPRELYRTLATELHDDAFWSFLHVFWSDERYVFPTDPASNVRLARESLLDLVPVPPENLHPPRTDLADPNEAARDYEREIVSFFEPAAPGLDWIFLGLGKDGHVASLFPGSPGKEALEERERLVIAMDESPHPLPVRLTMTFPLINQGREIHFLVTGEDKKEAVARVLAPDGPDAPARRVSPAEGQVVWWLDRAAAGAISGLFEPSPPRFPPASGR